MGKVIGGAAAVFIGCAALTGAGIADATPSLVGKTYAQAQELLSKWHLDSEVASMMGDELKRADCVVVNQVMRAATRMGQQPTPAKVFLSLDCTAAVASPGHPGNSAGSPEGRAAKNEALAEDWRQNTPDGQKWCADTKRAHPDWDWSAIKGCTA